MKIVGPFVGALVAASPVAAQDLVSRSLPAVGSTAEAEVGQAVLTSERYYTAPAVRLEKLVKSSSIMGNKIMLPAGLYTLTAETEKGRYYQSNIGVTLQYLGIKTPWKKAGLFMPASGGAVQAYWENDLGMRATGAVEGASVVEAGALDLGPDGYRVQLLYTGASGGVVTLSYREFMRDLSRPAFTQALTYDLSSGDEIGFRGARIKVTSATNVSMTYTVLKPLDAPTP
ncbi:hypothetical protein J2X45_003906 [Caulobacter sp. BE264]|uniref:hypothetical protein n=1 Tax=Caulobacter sp. BE264 TaxID=2817724 RepID=UPI002857CF24|nr:hypothetical protein [Caulobacter sp. BE264]MDR7232796.1 hypothetical protein [Caulobacter sp. BE264]